MRTIAQIQRSFESKGTLGTRILVDPCRCHRCGKAHFVRIENSTVWMEFCCPEECSA